MDLDVDEELLLLLVGPIGGRCELLLYAYADCCCCCFFCCVDILSGVTVGEMALELFAEVAVVVEEVDVVA